MIRKLLLLLAALLIVACGSHSDASGDGDSVLPDADLTAGDEDPLVIDDGILVDDEILVADDETAETEDDGTVASDDDAAGWEAPFTFDEEETPDGQGSDMVPWPDEPAELMHPILTADTGRDLDLTVSDPAGNGELVVTDRVTGLRWQQQVPADVGSQGLPGALTGWEKVLIYCDKLEYGGTDDWHLPTVDELATIVDYGRYDPATYLDAFPGTPAGPFWSSSWFSIPWGRFAGLYVWAVDFLDGHVFNAFSNNGYGVRCVDRAGIAPFSGTRFVETTTVDGRNIVTDRLTKLVWAKEYVADHPWEEIKYYCDSLVYGGRDDWRMPGVNEMRTFGGSSPDGSSPDQGFWTARAPVAYPDGRWVVYNAEVLALENQSGDFPHSGFTLDLLCLRGPVDLDNGMGFRCAE